MLDVVDLECARGDRRLFAGLSFSLLPGGLLHVRGPNGSGKTTLLRALCGLIKPMEGGIRWRGEDIHELAEDYYRDLTYIGHRNGTKEDLTAVENLRIAGTLAGNAVTDAAAMQALSQVGLEGLEDLPVRVMSEGQKRRVTLARLVVSKGALWILDEPFNALDVASTALVQSLLREHLNNQGMVIFTAHQEIDVPGRSMQHIHLSS